MTSRFTSEEVIEIKQLRNDGWTYKQLIGKYKCGCVCLQEVLGIDKPHETRNIKQLSDEEKQQIIGYREKGLMFTQIAKLLDNVSTHTIKLVIKKNNTT